MPPSLRVVVDAWRGITAAQVRVTLLAGLAYFLYQAIGLYGGDNQGLGRGPQAWLLLLPVRLATVFAVLLCVAVADRVSGQDPRRKAAHVWAVVAGSCVGTTIYAAAVALRGQTTLDWPVWAYLFLETAMLSGAAVAVCISFRRAQAAMLRMQQAELERVRMTQRTLASRLQAMQARVEPTFLFETLARVKRLHERDAPLAGRMLDGLIAYLRAAMPRMRDVSSTVAQEVALARSFVDILAADASHPLKLDVAVADGAADASLPPMVLLPLVSRLAGGQRRGPVTVRIAFAVVGDRLRLTVANQGASEDSVPIDALDELRERLAALFGSRARLDRSSGGRHEVAVTLEIPYEPAKPQASPGVGATTPGNRAASASLRAANR